MSGLQDRDEQNCILLAAGCLREMTASSSKTNLALKLTRLHF
jgi:hypothetical protein